MSADAALRDHVVRLLTTDWAHVTFDDAVGNLSEGNRGVRPPSHPHTPWQLLEHLRICQRDLVEYSRSPDYAALEFPKGYWPPGDAPLDGAAWDRSVAAFRNDLKEMVSLVRDTSKDLLAPLPWSKEGHTLLREALILADHNAYHVGQIVQLKKALEEKA